MTGGEGFSWAPGLPADPGFDPGKALAPSAGIAATLPGLPWAIPIGNGPAQVMPAVDNGHGSSR